MSILVVFGRKMIFIGHKLGQLVITDLLYFRCCFLRFHLVSLLYIWSLFRNVSEQAVSLAWIVSLQGRDHAVMLCSEKSTGESSPGNKGWRWAPLSDLASGLNRMGWDVPAPFQNFFDWSYSFLMKSHFPLKNTCLQCNLPTPISQVFQYKYL